MSNPYKGKFITFEGGEGSGKSTQVEYLSEFLKENNISVLATREPGGSEGAELIRQLLVKGDTHRWDAVTDALLMSAARRDHLINLIIPALKQGKWVICDRFADSTIAYQGYGHGVDLRYLQLIYELIAEDLTPDLTFIFDMDSKAGLERTHSRTNNEDRFERMDFGFHERIREGYRRLAQADLNRYVIIDASLEREKIAQQINDYVKKKLL